jgi:hypothetical protein
METYEPNEFLNLFAEQNGKQLLRMVGGNGETKQITFINSCKSIYELCIGMKEFYRKVFNTLYFPTNGYCVDCSCGDMVFVKVYAPNGDEYEIVANINQTLLQTNGKEQYFYSALLGNVDCNGNQFSQSCVGMTPFVANDDKTDRKRKHSG